uniref:Uncharacterized protein n=1 Tax=Oryza nivara TaxID=4536 RepID=A0A0E0FWM4_ORYNI
MVLGRPRRRHVRARPLCSLVCCRRPPPLPRSPRRLPYPRKRERGGRGRRGERELEARGDRRRMRDRWQAAEKSGDLLAPSDHLTRLARRPPPHPPLPASLPKRREVGERERGGRRRKGVEGKEGG